MIAVAWFALWIGGYDRKTIIRAGVISTVSIYIIVTIPIAAITHTELSKRDIAYKEVDRIYSTEQNQGNPIVAAFVPFKDEDYYEIYLYAGNYGKADYRGALIVKTYDESGIVIEEKKYEGLEIPQGDKLKVDRWIRYNLFDKYTFEFIQER